MTTHLVWLRNDLRVHDNSALHAACQDPHARVLAVFIATPQQWEDHDMSPRQAGFIHQHLCHMANDLAARGIMLHYQQCGDFTAQLEWLVEFCQIEHVNRLFYNYQYEFNERERDKHLEQRLGNNTLCHGFDDSVLLPPGSIHTGKQQMYKVYTPFRNAFLRRLEEQGPSCLPAPMPRSGAPYKNTSKISQFDYPTTPPVKDHPSGESAALSCLRNFCNEHLQDYHHDRDIPALDATSRLSAWLTVGVLSPRQCYQQMCQASPHSLTPKQIGAFTWLNQLIWRDFYRHLLLAYPEMSRYQPFISWTRHVAWRQDDKLFDAWCEGRTGYPFVDAAMRQLAETGWMHNRLRMISASFLIKDLLIDWRRGERYFMSQLIDGDLAANNGGWQWVASTGTDAVPYFRIFNPTKQGERYDSDGDFIRRWLPALKLVPNNYIHQPHLWPNAQYAKLDYPPQIVDHSKARMHAMAAYQAAKARSVTQKQTTTRETIQCEKPRLDQ